MRDYLTIGSSPAGEECAQVGSENYYERAMAECKAYIKQLRRVYGEEPAGARLKVMAFPHDFGTYHEVVVEFNDESDKATEYAYDMESGAAYWDMEARAELGMETVSA